MHLKCFLGSRYVSQCGNRRLFRAGFAMLAGLVSFHLPGAAQTAARPPGPADGTGSARSTKTKALELGARMLQNFSPVRQLGMHMVGLHPLRGHPEHQMVAHHYCHQRSEDFAQCVLYDGESAGARLNGVEYIISEKLYATLPAEEKPFWHPHNYEIFSGTLVAPGLPGSVENEALESKVNSYGKTWHFWNTGMPGEEGDPLPFGTPQLAWSLNDDSEVKPDALAALERITKSKASDKKEQRIPLRPLARPQEGEDLLAVPLDWQK